eukprot:CAMPEP_0113468618 /NCGR_PEP_ID=MMETSP0014_2-20120614/15454_1 /TAXON_ID=2857 /ORGANISM="Nitzschia sp." /LENGTH=212 /DNA_ID=CAMNT_0000361025 /DNA_START=152 /DNA_END=790 /DNA_ORIENTATION=+ /assembly_acc=CAM_ASM_000159
MQVAVVSTPPYYSSANAVRLAAVHTEQQTSSWGGYNATSEGSINKRDNDHEIRNLFNMGTEERNDFDSEQTSSSSSSSGLIPLSDIEREELKRQCAEIIERVISGGVDDLNRLHDSWKDKYEDQRRLRDAMQLNYLIQEKAFDDKVDDIISTFMSDTQYERDKTHRLFEEDEVKRRLQENEAKEKKIPKPIEPWGVTNNEFDDWDRWDDWTW